MFEFFAGWGKGYLALKIDNGRAGTDIFYLFLVYLSLLGMGQCVQWPQLKAIIAFWIDN